MRQVAERGRLDALAIGLGMDRVVIEKMGNKSLRKAIVLKANPAARSDGGTEYYRAAIDMLPTNRRDSAGADPYAEVSSSFQRNLQTGPARADAPELPDADNAWKANIDRAFRARHGMDVKA